MVEMKNKTCILLLISFCSLLACKKNNVPHYPINAALKAAFSFKPGTYWIYQDSLSGEIDSFYVEGFASGTYSSANPSYTYDAIGVTIRECHDDDPNNIDSSQWGFGLQQNTLAINDWEKPYYSSGLSYEPYDYYYNYSGIDYSLAFSMGYSYQNDTVIVLNSININTTQFNNVSCAHFSGNTTVTSKFSDYIFIDSTVGMIKIILDHPNDSVYRNYNILRWKIIK